MPLQRSTPCCAPTNRRRKNAIMRRRCGIWIAAGAALIAGAASPAILAQPYPAKPIRLVIGYEPGGGADNIARLMAATMSEVIGQQIVVDNRSGANGVVAAELVAKSPRDGYTIHVVTSSHVTNPAVYPKLAYDTIKDFTAVSELADAPLVMVVHPSMKASSVAEFIDIAKARPESLIYASAGLGNMTQVAAELFSQMAGIKMTHVPYKGSGPAIIDLIAGRITVYFPPVPSALPHIQSGKLKALAVGGGKRAQTVPALPTIAEAGLSGYEAGSWYGIVVPAATPSSIVTALHAASIKTLRVPLLLDRMKAQGLEPVGSSPAEFDARIKRDIVKWRRVFKEANIVMQ
jgi:tripartite-type tricarboxylate transporter receptor subunit TctC